MYLYGLMNEDESDESEDESGYSSTCADDGLSDLMIQDEAISKKSIWFKNNLGKSFLVCDILFLTPR